MPQPPDKLKPPQPEQHGGVWPPPPSLPEPQPAPIPAASYLTGASWLDSIMGVPCGFIVAVVVWGITGNLFDRISKTPLHGLETLIVCLVGLVLSSAIYYLSRRAFPSLAFSMWFGGIPFYLLTLYLSNGS